MYGRLIGWTLTHIFPFVKKGDDRHGEDTISDLCATIFNIVVRDYSIYLQLMMLLSLVGK